MEINSRVEEILKEFKIPKNDGMCYLLSLYYGYSPGYIPNGLKEKVSSTGIVETGQKDIKWNLPLFDGQETNFEWVKKEYEPIFRKANPDKGGHVNESIKRLKELFSKYPDIRKDDVLGSARLYVGSKDRRFIRKAHFFIKKGRGVNEIRDILDWVDRYRLSNEKETKRNHKTNTMQ